MGINFQEECERLEQRLHDAEAELHEYRELGAETGRELVEQRDAAEARVAALEEALREIAAIDTKQALVHRVETEMHDIAARALLSPAPDAELRAARDREYVDQGLPPVTPIPEKKQLQ